MKQDSKLSKYLASTTIILEFKTLNHSDFEAVLQVNGKKFKVNIHTASTYPSSSPIFTIQSLNKNP